MVACGGRAFRLVPQEIDTNSCPLGTIGLGTLNPAYHLPSQTIPPLYRYEHGNDTKTPSKYLRRRFRRGRGITLKSERDSFMTDSLPQLFILATGHNNRVPVDTITEFPMQGLTGPGNVIYWNHTGDPLIPESYYPPWRLLGSA